MNARVPNLTDTVFIKLLTYAITGSGFYNMKPALKKITNHELPGLKDLFDKWLDGRDLASFYATLFDTYGFTCEEVRLSTNREIFI